jgi:hypothetical protein
MEQQLQTESLLQVAVGAQPTTILWPQVEMAAVRLRPLVILFRALTLLLLVVVVQVQLAARQAYHLMGLSLQMGQQLVVGVVAIVQASAPVNQD